MKIAYQGIKNSNSYFAAIEIAKKMGLDKYELVAAKSSEGVVALMLKGECELGVMAKVNSTMGLVKETKKALGGYSYNIVCEHKAKIEHCLFSSKGQDISKVEEVSSHPQALGQCSAHLDEYYSSAKRVPARDTSDAARQLADSTADNKLVICSEAAGRHYGLNLVSTGIQNDPDNTTKFIAIDSLYPDNCSIGTRILRTLSRTPGVGKFFGNWAAWSSITGHWKYRLSPREDEPEKLPYGLQRIVKINYNPFTGGRFEGWTEGGAHTMFKSRCAWSLLKGDHLAVGYEYLVEPIFGEGIEGWVNLSADIESGKSSVNKLEGKYAPKSKARNLIGGIEYKRINKDIFLKIKEGL